MRQWLEKWRSAFVGRQDNPLLHYGRRAQPQGAAAVRRWLSGLALLLLFMLLAAVLQGGNLARPGAGGTAFSEWSLLFVALALYGLYFFSGLSSALQRAFGMLARLPSRSSLLSYNEELALCGLTAQDMLLSLYLLALPQLLLRTLGGLVFLAPFISAYLFFGNAFSSPGLLFGGGFAFFSFTLLIPQALSALLACLILLNLGVLLGRGIRSRIVFISSAALLCAFQLSHLQASSQLISGSSFAYASPLSGMARHEMLLFFFCLGLLLALAILRLSLAGSSMRSALLLGLPGTGLLLSAIISYLHRLPVYAGSWTIYEEAVRLQLMNYALWLLSWPLPLTLAAPVSDPAAAGPSPMLLALLRIAGQLVLAGLTLHAAELSLRRSIEED